MNMINNLFSIFDPSTSFISLAWIRIIPLSILIRNKKFIRNTKMKTLIKVTMAFIKKEISQLIKIKTKINPDIIRKIFVIILLINFIAIYPFIFTETAHISISFTIRLTIWLSIIIFSWKNNFKGIIAHLTPMGTPGNLINFIVIIETIRSIIRPITLSIRLSANIVAGHLLLSLLSSFSIASNINFIISYIPLLILISLEIIVALVQAYVLTTLMTLYQNESN